MGRRLRLLFTIALTLSLVPVFADGWSWHPVANTMCDQRWAPASCLLPDGHTALICGGYSFTNGGCVSTGDIFDERTKSFIRATGHLNFPRDFATATLLPNRTILIAGGFNDVFGSLSMAELYDPATQTFTLANSHMLSPRELHTANLLRDGTVLIVGGLDLTKRRTQDTAEIYMPGEGRFVSTRGHMTDDRFGHAACLLNDGRVFIVGGTSVLFGHGGYAHILASAEIYDPSTGVFSECRSHLALARDRPTANLLLNGTVLIAGGQGTGGAAITTSEVYDPATDAFTPIANPQVVARMAHNTSSLSDGTLILTGGWSSTTKSTTNSTEVFYPATKSFVQSQPLPFSSHDAAQVLFPDGILLVAGGKTVSSAGAADGVNLGAWARP